jgi:N,N'-diacetylchitobiose transport system substrate-binding protein
MFKAGTGSDQLPKTEDDLLKALDKVQDKYKKDNAFSALYLPGRYWYAAMSYVAAYGGEIATYDEGSKEWKAALSTPEAQKGIQHFIDLVKKYNHGDQTKDEQDHANVMANEKTALLYGNAWEAGSVVDSKTNGNPKLKDKIATAGMPGPEGKALPSFIGGSDLATVSKSDQQDLGQEWISLFTNEKSQAALAEKNILPNNTKQLEPLKAKPETAPIANAVPDAWFTPIAPGWSAIEKKETLETMLLDILKGKSVADATKAADAEINSLINEAS